MGERAAVPGGLQATVDRETVIQQLQELIEALDRRVPRLGEAGESDIAREAALLKERAVARLAQLHAPRGPAD